MKLIDISGLLCGRKGLLFLFFIITTKSFSQDVNQIHISEFMASNTSTIVDEDGDYSDWIELYNPTSSAINLGGWYLSDNPDELIKWIFPQIQIDAYGYVLIFCSGKDRRGAELHSNFKLSGSGEWIILTKPDGKTIGYTFENQYPEQYPNISYGFVDGHLCYQDQPTPGAPNVAGDFLTPPTFSMDRGFYYAPFNLEIISYAKEGVIKYTLDGSDPTFENGIEYTQSLLIDSTTVIKAVVTNGASLSRAATYSFIFPEKVKDQSTLPEGYPAYWGSFSKIPGNAPADYGMDPEICGSPDYRELIAPALVAIPTISLVTDINHFFSLSTDPLAGGIYIHTNPPDDEDWERPVSMEYLLPDTGQGIQAHCGVRIHGGASRVPEKNPKHSFRVVFRDEYGPATLNRDLLGETATNSFNSLILRAGFNQTWTHWDGAQRVKSQHINDSWAKDVYSNMGHLAAHNKFVHLYINGLYWGLYNLSERMDDDFMASYLNGEKEDFDVIKDYAEVAEGNADAWTAMMDMAKEGLSDAYSYYAIQGKNEFGADDDLIDAYLDVENLIDFMILNFYAGNQDWDHHNWVAVRNRIEPEKGFQFIPWDSERIFYRLSDNIVEENNEGRPSFLYSQLRHNPIFRRQFAKRANALLSPGGLLGPESVIAGWQNRSNEIELAIITESARWGDYRRDVHPYKKEPYELYTKNDHWLVEQKWLNEVYFPERSQIVLDQLKEIGLAGEIITALEPIDRMPGLSHSSYPNPFDKKVMIKYYLDQSSAVQVDVFTKEGKLVERLFSGHQKKGTHKIEWNPGKLKSGLYFYHIQKENEVYNGKMIYVK